MYYVLRSALNEIVINNDAYKRFEQDVNQPITFGIFLRQSLEGFSRPSALIDLSLER